MPHYQHVYTHPTSALFSLHSHALELNNQTEQTLERRDDDSIEAKWWEQLTLAQKFSASS